MRQRTCYARRPVLVLVASLSLVAAQDLLIQGEEDPTIVSAVVQAKQAAIRACYDRRLQTRPELEGNVQVRFEIGSTGAVTSALVVRSSLADPEVEGCLVKLLLKLVFKKPKHGTVIVNYPFQFTSNGRAIAALEQKSTRLSERSVAAALRKERPRFEQCYQPIVDKEPVLRGARVSLSFAVGAEGEPVETTIDTSATLPDPLSKCMLSTLASVRFARPVYGEHAKVTWPFILWGK